MLGTSTIVPHQGIVKSGITRAWGARITGSNPVALTMDARELPHSFRTALALFNALRCLGFESEQIFFCYNTKQGFVVEIHKDGGEWGFRTGQIDMSYEKWKVEWKKVADAMVDGSISQESIDAVWLEFYPKRMKVVEVLTKAGIRIPKIPTSLETTS